MRHLTPFALFESSSDIKNLTDQVWNGIKNAVGKKVVIPVSGFDFQSVVVVFDSTQIGHFDPNASDDFSLTIHLDPNGVHKEALRHELTHAFQFSKKKNWNHDDEDKVYWQQIDLSNLEANDKMVLEKFINMTYYFQNVEIDAKIEEFADVIETNGLKVISDYKKYFFEYLDYKNYDVKKELTKLDASELDSLLYLFYSFKKDNDIEITQQVKDQFFTSYQNWFNKQYKRFETKLGRLIAGYNT